MARMSGGQTVMGGGRQTRKADNTGRGKSRQVKWGWREGEVARGSLIRHMARMFVYI